METEPAGSLDGTAACSRGRRCGKGAHTAERCGSALPDWAGKPEGPWKGAAGLPVRGTGLLEGQQNKSLGMFGARPPASSVQRRLCRLSPKPRDESARHANTSLTKRVYHLQEVLGRCSGNPSRSRLGNQRQPLPWRNDVSSKGQSL